jgi:hypothetical protein
MLRKRLRSALSGARSAPAERLQRFERRFDGAELGGESAELRFEGAPLLVRGLSYGNGYEESGRLRSFPHHVRPQAPADTEGRKQAEPGTPGNS